MLEQIARPAAKLIRLVIVEDYKLTRVGLFSVLNSDQNIEVIADAEDAEAGLAAIFEMKPDVVLMDLSLPGISGIEATQKIKAFNKNIRVIIYTSHEEEQTVIAALGAGADAYCVKDNSPTNLIDTIKAVAEGAAWLDPAIADIALEIFRKPPTHLANNHNSSGFHTHQNGREQSVKLTERELEVLTLIVEGKSNTQIANTLMISPHTAKEHVCNILQKLAVHDRVQAAVKAIKQGIV